MGLMSCVYGENGGGNQMGSVWFLCLDNRRKRLDEYHFS